MSKDLPRSAHIHNTPASAAGVDESVATRFFISPDNVKKILTQAVRKKVGRPARVDLKKYDALCRLATNRQHGWNDLKSNHSVMTPFLFSILSFEVHLKVDEVLVPKMDKPADLKWVIEHMKRNNARLAAACGGDARVSMEEAAPVYVILKALEEIEPPRH